MTYRFAVRWTAIGLACALAILAAAFVLNSLRPASQLPPQQVSYEQLLAAAEMPLDASGAGTQIISGTVLTLTLQPYPARAATPVTLTLVGVSLDGHISTAVSPTLMISNDSLPGEKEYALALQPDHSYAIHGNLFPQPGAWHLRLDAYVGDEVPANILLTVNAR